MDIFFSKKGAREFKGKSLIDFPNEYIVLDLETTGTHPYFCDIIEVAAVKYKDNLEIDRFSTLVKLEEDILDDFIVTLTGITEEMLENAPNLESVLQNLKKFLGDTVIVAHNANFDINFLYDKFLNKLNYKFNNNFIDTLRLSRRLLPNLENHKLKTLTNYFNLSNPVHRASDDVECTQIIFEKLKNITLKDYGDINNFQNIFKKKRKYTDLSKITTDNTEFDTDNNIYNNTFVFTGKLSLFSRPEIAKIIVDLGGKVKNRISNDIDYLVIGEIDFTRTKYKDKSSKQIKVEELISNGHDIKIISENTFMELLDEVNL